MKLAVALVTPILLLPLAPASAAPISCSTSPKRAAVAQCLEMARPALDQAYQQVAASAGQPWRSPSMVTFWKKPPAAACESLLGGVQSSFFCADTNTAYMMLSIAKESTQRYAASAPLRVLRKDAKTAGVTIEQLREGNAAAAQVNVLAHEMAHSLLNSAGVAQWYAKRADRFKLGSSKYDRFGFVHETAADCLSGVVQRKAKDNGGLRMTAFDLWAARADYAGSDPFDDARPTASPFVYPNAWGSKIYKGYGGPYIRVKAFNQGWEQTSAGNPLQMCVAFAAGLKKVPVAPSVR